MLAPRIGRFHMYGHLDILETSENTSTNLDENSLKDISDRNQGNTNLKTPEISEDVESK